MSQLFYDEKNPAPLGHRLARPYVSWLTYVLLVIAIPIMIVDWLYLLEWCTSYPLVIPILVLILLCLVLAGFLFNALRWGAQYRDRLTTSNGRGDGLDAVTGHDCDAEAPDENMMRDRLLRVNNDQWFMSSLLITLFIVELFLTIFLATSGLDTYAPFPSTFGDGTQVRNNLIMKIFYALILCAIGGSFIVLMYTGSDFAYRQAFALSEHHREETGHAFPVNSKKPLGNRRGGGGGGRANALAHDD